MCDKYQNLMCWSIQVPLSILMQLQMLCGVGLDNVINFQQYILRYTVANSMSLYYIAFHWLTSGFMQLTSGFMQLASGFMQLASGFMQLASGYMQLALAATGRRRNILHVSLCF